MEKYKKLENIKKAAFMQFPGGQLSKKKDG